MLRHRKPHSTQLLASLLTLLVFATGCKEKEPPVPPIPAQKPKQPKQRFQPRSHIGAQRKTPSLAPTKRAYNSSNKVKRGNEDVEPQKLTGKQRNLARSMHSRVGGRNRRVKPVYYDPKVKENPLAIKLCHAMHELPAKRKAACCKKTGTGYTATKECIRNLSIALKYGSIKINSEQAKRCVKALHKRHEGCNWVGVWNPLPPPACHNIVKGDSPLNKPCRSNLECKNGLQCYGLGSTSVGRCYPPLPVGSRCGTGVDTLATYTLQHHWREYHPTCKGYCHMYQCKRFSPPGGKCRANVHCTKGYHCAAGVCKKGIFAQPGQACSGRCVEGYRCIKRKCQKLKKVGEICTSEFECEGGCLPVRGKNIKRCGMRCRLPIFDRLHR